MQASKAERAAQRFCAGDPQKFEQLPGRLDFDATPTIANFQAGIEVDIRAGAVRALRTRANRDAIEDRTRNMRGNPSWDSPAGIVDDAAGQYREDLWRGQDFRPECWIEKDALLGVIEQICEDFRLQYFACRGNNSESEQYKAGKRFDAHLASGVTPIVLHLGDHDPSGLDMTRDNRDRLAMFARRGVEVRRSALNMDQIERWHPPPNPAKKTDSRYAAHAEKFGSERWELDALDPTVIADLIRDEIGGMLDADAWNAAKDEETANRALLEAASRNWAVVENFFAGVK